MRYQHDLHRFQRAGFLGHQLLQHVADRIDQAIAQENADERTDHRGADFLGDLAGRGAAAHGAHRDHDAEHGRQNAETGHRFADLAQRLGRLRQFFVDQFQFLLEHAFEFVRVDLAHCHQAEVVDDECQQLLFFQHGRVALEDRAVLGRLDVGIEGLQAAGGQLQQLVHQQQQLALEFRVVLLAHDDFLQLVRQLVEDVPGIAQHERADARAGDHEHLDRVPDRRERAAHQHVPAEDAAENNEKANDLLHGNSFLLCAGSVGHACSTAFILPSAALFSWHTRASVRSSTAAISL
nr:hypothetical protein [Pseudoduganella dura]